MINCRNDIDEILNNLDYIKIVPSYYENSENYKDDLCYVKYITLDQNIKKDLEKSFVVIDTETTGLSPNYKDKIVQVTAIKFENFKPTQIFTTLINPNRLIPNHVSKIHGITNEDVEFSPLFIEIKDALSEFIKGEIIIGHNVQFDLNFLLNEGVDLLNLDVKVIDTLQLARQIISKEFIENYKLGTLCKYFCLDYFNYHNATEDVLATSYLFMNLLNMYFIDDVILF